MLDLKAMRERCEKATKGPWTRQKPEKDESGFAQWVMIAGTLGRQGIYANPPGGQYPSADADFIAHSRSDMEQLLEAVEEAHKIIHETMRSCVCCGAKDLDEMGGWLARFK